ncbi:MAG: S41 family peptidase [Saprospiraceae bacterium]
MIQYRLSLIMLLLPLLSGAQEASSPFVRFPSLSPDGKQVAFSYEGDIWTASAEGGQARRLTIHEGYEAYPQWSTDGKKIAFHGNRFGNNDIFVMDASGGNLKRLTYHSANDAAPQWAADGTILFHTTRYFQEIERVPEIYQISADGGTPFRVMDALGSTPVPSPDGRYIAYMSGSNPTDREPYMGPASRDIWMFDREKKIFTQLTTFKGMDILPDWGKANQLFYLSAEKGRYNIYLQTINAGKAEGAPQQLTSFTDEGIRNFDVSADGSTIVFEKGNQIYLMPVKGSPKPLKIQVSADARFDAVETKTQSGGASEMALSPNGKLIAFSVRGEIFVTLNDKEAKRTAAITNHPYRDQNMQWLNDSTLLFISDRTGNKEIYLATSADKAQPSLYKTLKLETRQLTNTPEDENDILLSPDRKKVALRKGRGQLIVADIDEKGAMTNAKTLLDGWATPGGLAWSPDSKWLAYSLDDLNFNEEVYIHAADNSRAPVNVSMHPRSDGSPIWSPDGSKLGFTSLHNNGDYDVWFAWLKKSDWEKTKPDWEEEKEDKPSNGKDDKKEDKEETPVVEIDFDDIYERLVQVTRLPGNESNLVISKDGQTFYFTTNGPGREGSAGDPDLMSVKWDGTDSKRLAEKFRGRQLAPDKEGKNIYFLQDGGKLGKFIIDGSKQENIPFDAKMEINYPEERKQMFAEGWRSLRDGFYDPKFHGRDWDALRKRYEAYALSASTTQDFQDMFNEMLGQLDASHMGFRGPTPESTQRDQTGDLGIEVKPHKEGVEILRVIPDGPADKTGSKLEPGMVIRSVNGESVTAAGNFFSLLNNTANQRVLLEVKTKEGSVQEVVIRPVSSIRDLLYENWVQRCRDLTGKYSGGRLGYLHIQGMNWPSFERFERELMAAGHGKEGIVIDVRYNGGGWTTDMLMAVLNVRQHSYTIPRGASDDLSKDHGQFKDYYPYGERLPLAAWTKPTVALCNESSYSNAEIFSHAYKALGLGKLVGTPTFGAVISTGAQGLIDGSYVRMPFRGWYVKATGENMENGPAVPDFVLENGPDSKAKGEDEQLKKAVEVLLGQLKK